MDRKKYVAISLAAAAAVIIAFVSQASCGCYDSQGYNQQTNESLAELRPRSRTAGVPWVKRSESRIFQCPILPSRRPDKYLQLNHLRELL